MTDLTIEQQRALALARARKLAAEAEGQPTRTRRSGGGMAMVNEGIARGLGAPVDIVAGGLSRLGIDTGPAPFGGAESIRRGMEWISADPARRDPEGIIENALLGAGEAAGFLLPTGAVGRAVQTGGGPLASRVADTIMRPFAAAPAGAVATEIAAGAGARVGGELASDAGGDVARPFGELAGGLAAAMTPWAAMRAATGTARVADRVASVTPGVGLAWRTAKAALAPMAMSGAEVRASDRLRGLVADPDGAAARVAEDSPGSLSPAQRTGEPGLLALERTAAETDPRFRERLDAQIGRSSDALRDDMRAPADGRGAADAAEFFERRRATFRDGLIRRRDGAMERAREIVARLDPARRETENALIVRQEIDRAYDAGAAQERALWGRVPRNAQVPVDRARAVFQQLDAETGRARKGDIPNEARALLGEEGGFGGRETVREMHDLYSRLRQTAREAMSGPAPNENRARIANSIAEAILEDLGATGGMPTATGRLINEARAFSRELNEVFGQGTVGDLTARQRTGGENIAPERALAASVGRGGAAGAVAVDDIRRAAGSSVDQPIDDYLRGQLTDRAMRRGDFNPDAADTFVRSNRETLQRFPDLSRDIGAAQAATRESASRSQRIDAIVKALDDPRRTPSAAFLNAAPGDEIAAAVLKAKSPVSAARALRAQAAKDETGRALAGLKGAFLDNLIGSTTRGADETGRRAVAGSEMLAALQDPRRRAAFAAVFDSAELSRMDRVAREFQRIEAARKSGRLESVMDDAPNTIISFVARTMAARQGAKLGQGTSGASLLTANFASRRVQRILESLTNDRAERLIRDALEDPDLFRALMTQQRTQVAREAAEKPLVEWFIGTAGVAASEAGGEE